MSAEDIRVEDPEEVKILMQATVSFIEGYKNTLGEDLRSFDEVGQLCEMAKQAVLSRHEELSEESKNAPRNGSETHSRVQEEIEECRVTLSKLVQYAEEIEGMKRDTSTALTCVQSIIDDVNGLKSRVDALMNALINVL